MTTAIIAALTLALVQLWLLPLSTKLKDTMWLLGTRDVPKSPTVMQSRIMRAGINLQESLPAFLALCLLAMIKQIDLSQIAFAWLALRVIYVPCYTFGINPIRSIVWLLSLGCLMYMAYSLI